MLLCPSSVRSTDRGHIPDFDLSRLVQLAAPETARRLLPLKRTTCTSSRWPSNVPAKQRPSVASPTA